MVDCVDFGMILNPGQALYRVQSSKKNDELEPSRGTNGKDESDKSLQLKPECRPGYVVEPETPSKGHEDTAESSEEEPSPLKIRSADKGVPKLRGCAGEDDFENAIAETKLMRHLVSEAGV